jgi:phospholipid/cholesterol/gamma-HCH transport system permease protein
MATAAPQRFPLLARFRTLFEDMVIDLGDLTLFTLHVLRGVPRRLSRETLLPISYSVGIQSIPVVAITGMFIGMVLAVQAYGEFHDMGLETRLGGIINISVIRELGPVLAAFMLAGRVGSSMAAELATMRTTEQIEAITCLGADPVHYLATPRFLACVLLIPLLTVLADFMGVVGGALISLHVYHIEPHYYWVNSRDFIEPWDFFTGLVKPVAFAAGIAIISCHRGFYSEPGAEGVGQASTRAFVASFIVILALDFFLALLLQNIYHFIYS